MLSYTFWITSLIVVLMPGTGVIYTISTGIVRGKKNSIYAAIGCTAGIIPHMTIGILALVFFHEVNEYVFQVMKILGGGYLIYLGIDMIRSGQSIQLKEDDQIASSLRIVIKGILINLLNPKLTIFFLAFLPQYIEQGSNNIIAQGIFLGLIFMAITLFVFLIYGLLAGTFHSFIKASERRIIWLQRVFGIIFIIFAIQLMRSQF